MAGRGAAALSNFGYTIGCKRPLIAISGLHIAMIAAIFVQLMRFVGLPRVACGLLLIPALWLYVAATGWQASAVRSSVMVTIVAMGWILKRPGDLVNSLAAAAVLILLWEPQLLFMTGFQLSFCVVFSIAMFALPLQKRIQKPAATRSATAARVMAVVVAFCGSDCDTVARRVRCGLAGFAAVSGIDVQPVYAGDAARQRAHRFARWLGSGQQSWLFGFCCLASSCFGVVRPQRLAVDVFNDVAQRNGGRIAVWASVCGCAADLADVDLRGGSCVMGIAVGAENQAPWDAGSDRLGLCVVCGGELGQARRVYVDRAASRQRLGTTTSRCSSTPAATPARGFPWCRFCGRAVTTSRRGPWRRMVTGITCRASAVWLRRWVGR